MTTKTEKKTMSSKRHVWWFVATWLAVAIPPGLARAQTFDSGSTGADGAFDLSSKPPGTTVEFNPAVLGIDADKDNVFHFTTVKIPTGVTVKLSAKWVQQGPVYWLASGAVEIAGTVELSGDPGHPRTQNTALRAPAVPGPGGYAGGVGGNLATGSQGAAQSGLGSKGGLPYPGNGASSGTCFGNGGSFGGGRFLVPLFGGSGGGGASTSETQWWGGGGGAGGGAILIASSISISVTGVINAYGGLGGKGTDQGGCHYAGGSGAGGAIRLAAPTVLGSGALRVSGGSYYVEWNGSTNCASMAGGSGFVRIEAFNHNDTFAITGNWNRASPLATYLSAKPARIRVVSIAGVPVPASPSGTFELPDVTFNNSGPVAVEVEAQGVPVGTVAKLYLLSLDANDQIINTPPLVGTKDQSSTSVSVTFPPGFTRGYARATW